jgi:hypothetical protein
MAHVRLRATHGIVIALDMESLDQMRKVVDRTCDIPGIVGYKVGLIATLRGSGSAVPFAICVLPPTCRCSTIIRKPAPMCPTWRQNSVRPARRRRSMA